MATASSRVNGFLRVSRKIVKAMTCFSDLHATPGSESTSDLAIRCARSMPSYRDVPIHYAHLGDQAGVIGAASLLLASMNR